MAWTYAFWTPHGCSAEGKASAGVQAVAGVGDEEARDEREGGRLARAVGTDERHHLALAHGE